MIKVKDLLDLGLWCEYCEIYNKNEWAVNEGLIDTDEYVEINTKKLNIKLIK